MEQCVQNSKGGKNIFSPFHTQLNYLSAMKKKENSGLKSLKRLFSHVFFFSRSYLKMWSMKNEVVNKPQKRKSCHLGIRLRHRPENKTFAWIKIMEAEKLSESHLRSYLIHLTIWTIVLRIRLLEPRHLSKRGQRGGGAIVNPNNVKMFTGKEE